MSGIQNLPQLGCAGHHLSGCALHLGASRVHKPSAAGQCLQPRAALAQDDLEQELGEACTGRGAQSKSGVLPASRVGKLLHPACCRSQLRRSC